MKKGIFLLPSAITLLGMLLGFYAVIQALAGNYYWSAFLIMVSAVIDACDGPIARYTRTQSTFGAELDSLSDLICFGLAPALLGFFWSGPVSDEPRLSWLLPFVFLACGALRLARSNVQAMGNLKHTPAFSGLPIPAGAGVIISAVLLSEVWRAKGIHLDWAQGLHEGMPLLMLLVSFAMVSTVPYHSLKELDLKQKTPFRILVYFVMILIILVLRPELTWFTGFLLYALSGPLELLLSLKAEKAARRTWHP